MSESTQPVEMVPPGRALSPSKIKAMECPHRWASLYGLPVPVSEPKSPELEMGTLCHTVAGAYVTLLRERRLRTDQVGLAHIIERVWNTRGQEACVLSEDDYAEFEQLCLRLNDFAIEPEDIYDVEVHLGFDANWKAVPWRDEDGAAHDLYWGGIVDVVMVRQTPDGPFIEAWDWTTGAIGGALGAAKEFQLRQYGNGLYELLGIPKVRIKTISLRTGARAQIDLDAGDHAATKRRLDGIDGRAQELRSLLEAGIPLEVIPGQQCSICRLKCPLMADWQAIRSPLRFESEADAVEALKELLALDARRKDLTTALRGFTKRKGAVEVNGRAIGYRRADKVEFPADAVIELAAHHGYDPAQVLKVDKKMLYREFKGDRDFIGEIESHKVETTDERFGLYSPGEAEDQGGDS